jgi:hypothetical protein
MDTLKQINKTKQKKPSKGFWGQSAAIDGLLGRCSGIGVV